MRYTGRAIEFIRANRDQPFFLYLPHTFPHTPSYASEEYEGRSPYGLYADTVEEIDHSTGQILRSLDELDLARHTLVVFTSDNGPRVSGIGRGGNRWGDRGGGGSPGPLRGHKSTTWEGGMRVPGIFRWPGRIAAGETAEVASIADLLPTLAEFAGAKLPQDRTIDGDSLVSLLNGDGQSLGDRLFCYYFGTQLQAVRLGRWKLILKIDRYPAYPASIWYQGNRALFERHYRLLESAELYDLKADISESRNVAADHQEIVARLTGLAHDFEMVQ
jgi:arylsulfatase A-like enzyme